MEVGSYVTHRGQLLEVKDIMPAFGEDYAILEIVETGDIVTAPVKELVEL